MPEDIYRTLWRSISDFVISGHVATTRELYDEMCRISGDFGECVRSQKDAILLEVGNPDWDSLSYIRNYDRMRQTHSQYISEYSHLNSRKTICLNDLTIIALAQTLNLPVVSMESSAGLSAQHRRIPDICLAESVQHFSFNEFLRAEQISS